MQICWLMLNVNIPQLITYEWSKNVENVRESHSTNDSNLPRNTQQRQNVFV